jgi:hypothetical protein
MAFLRLMDSRPLELLSVSTFLWRHRVGDSWINGIGGAGMSNFAPHAVATPYHFEITQNGRGYWVAQDNEGLIGGVFRSQRDALRFALFEAAGDSARVRVLAADGAPVRAPSNSSTRRKRGRH